MGTINNPELFWAALGAISQAIEAGVVAFTVIAVVNELRRSKEESIENRIVGLNAAIEVLDSESFQKLVKEVKESSRIHGLNWYAILNQINQVALFVDEGFTKERLLFNLRGHDLAVVGEYLRVNLPDDLKSELGGKYSGANELLAKAQAWSAEHSFSY